LAITELSRGLTLRRKEWRPAVLPPDSLPAETWALPRECGAARSTRDCRSRSDKGMRGILTEAFSKDAMTVDGGIWIRTKSDEGLSANLRREFIF